MVNLIHKSVVSVAQQTPDACAFRCGDKQFTYAELDAASDRLARFLVRQGAQRGDRIGVFMPRCVETVVAVYGILKAGCIFVPIDPNLTAGGVSVLVNDCRIKLLLTQPQKTRVLNRLAQLETSLECLIGTGEEFDDGTIRSFPWSAFGSEETGPPDVGTINAGDAAYIMYSSGSTGAPKGITHTHYSGLSYSRLSIQTYGVTADDIIANHSPISFDMSTFGYFTSMLAGATTVLIPEAHTKFPRSLAGLIEQEQITIWYSVPLALIQLMLRTDLASFDMSSIRWVKYGGEPFAPRHLRELMRLWPHSRFSNVYGPAEVNQCTYYHIPPAYADGEDVAVPIGRVWDESEGLIIDDSDRVLHNGKAGELVISSPTMMQGYWARPDLNAAAFFENEADGVRRTYYRTGDLVRRNDDGTMMFLGRKDRQVKIRGYRIELDEIESALCGLPEIEEAGVFCVSKNDDKQIHAAVILDGNAVLSEDTIRTRLLSVLSPYAVPAVIQIVTGLPRTVSGKIDRTTLAKQTAGVTGS